LTERKNTGANGAGMYLLVPDTDYSIGRIVRNAQRCSATFETISFGRSVGSDLEPADLVDSNPAQHQEIISPLGQIDRVLGAPQKGLDVERHVDHIVADGESDLIQHLLPLGRINLPLDLRQERIHLGFE
jgi:hypothetical protein